MKDSFSQMIKVVTASSSDWPYTCTCMYEPTLTHMPAMIVIYIHVCSYVFVMLIACIRKKLYIDLHDTRILPIAFAAMVLLAVPSKTVLQVKYLYRFICIIHLVCMHAQ